MHCGTYMQLQRAATTCSPAPSQAVSHLSDETGKVFSANHLVLNPKHLPSTFTIIFAQYLKICLGYPALPLSPTFNSRH